MRLLELLFGKVERPPAAPSKPAPIRVAEEPLCVYATCAGELMVMEDIPDPVFACGAMGPAVGIKPSSGIIYAPASGTITVMTSTLHALGLISDDGVEILIHAGVDTVNMKADGFYGFVRQGQRVHAGEPLMCMDLDKIAEAGYSDVAITVITNADAFDRVTVADAGTVAAGERVMAAER